MSLNANLGDATLDLMANIRPLAEGLTAAETMTDNSMARMAASVRRNADQMGQIGTRLQQQFAAPSMRNLGINVDTTTKGLAAASKGMTDYAALAVSNMRQIAAQSVLTSAVVDAGARTQVAAIDSVTRAYGLQAAAILALKAAQPMSANPGAYSMPSLTPAYAYAGRDTGPIGHSGLIYGARGSSNAGSIDNPIVVTLEAGQYADMGSRAALIGAASAAGDSTGSQGGGGPVLLGGRAGSRSGGEGGSGAGAAYYLPPAPGRSVVPYQPSSLESMMAMGSMMRLAFAQGMTDVMNQQARVPRQITAGSTDTETHDRTFYHSTYEPPDRKRRPGTAIVPYVNPRKPPRVQSQQDYLDSLLSSIAANNAASSGGGGGGASLPPVALGGGGGGSSGGGGGGGANGALASTLLWGNHGGSNFGRHLPVLRWFGGLPGAGFGSAASFAGLGPEHAVATAGGVIGSGALGLAGGGLLALGGAGALAVGGGSDLAVTKSTITDTAQISKAYTAVNTAVMTYGQNSRQAALAQKQLNDLIKTLGDTVGVKAEETLAKNADALNTLFDKESGAARVQSANILEQGLNLGNVYLPLMLKAATQNLQIINRDIKPLFSWLEGPEGIGIWNNLEDNFKKSLPDAVGAFTQGVQLLLRITSLASDYTGGFTKKLDDLLTRLNRHSDSYLNDEIGKLVGEFRDWEKLIGAVGTDLHLLFSQDAGTGQSIVVSLTNMLQLLGKWEASSAGSSELHSVFEVHKKQVLELLQLLPSLVSSFGHIYLDLAPALTGAFTTVVKEIATVLNALTKLSPLAADMVGLGLVAAKLGLLPAILKGIGSGLGTIGKNLGIVGAGEGAIAEETGGLQILSGRRGAGGAVVGAGSAVTAEEEGTGLAAIVGGLKASLVSGGLGILAGTIAQKSLGLRTGTTGTVLGGLAGAGAGALIGTEFGGPFGTAIGAALGAALGPTIEHWLGLGAGRTYGKKFAQGFVGIFGDQLTHSTSKSFKDLLANDYNTYQNALKQLDQRRHTPGSVVGQNVPNVPGGTPGLSPGDLPPGVAGLIKDQRDKLIAAETKNGTDAANAMISVLSAVPFKSTPVFITDFINGIDALPNNKVIRGSAAQTMINFAASLEANGQLPEGSSQKVIDAIQAQFPGLTAYIKSRGPIDGKVLSDNFKFADALKTLKEMMKTAQGQFGILGADPTSNGTNWRIAFGHEIEQLELDTHSKIQATRKAAVQELMTLRTQSGQVISGWSSDINAQFSALGTQVQNGSATAGAAVWSLLQTTESSIYSLVQSGVMTQSQGNKLIADETNKALKALGSSKTIHIQEVSSQFSGGPRGNAAALTGGQSNLGALPAHGLGAVGSSTFGGTGAAQGALIQFGNAGDRGPDAIPLSMGGHNIVVGSGEMGAVFTHQQQSVANKYLAPVGGLPGLFKNVTRPHYLAQGGMIGSGSFASMVAEADAIAAQHYNYEWGGGHGAIGVPGHGTGHGSGPGVGFDCSGTVSAVLHAGGYLNTPLVAADFMKWGLPGPGEVTVYASPSHTWMSIAGREFGTGMSTPGGGAGWQTGEPIAGFSVRHPPLDGIGGFGISTPVAGGSGAMQQMIQASLATSTQAANSYIMKQALNQTLGMSATGAGDVGNSTQTGALVGNILQIAQQAAKAEGVAWVPSIVRLLLSKESAGGVNEPAGGSLSATGPFQVIPSTFAGNDSPGHTDINNPYDNALAAFHYIKGRYGSLQNLEAVTGLATSAYVGYGGGGLLDAYATGGITKKKVPAPKKPKNHAQSHTKGTKPGKVNISSALSNLALVNPHYASLIGTITGDNTEANDISSALDVLSGLPQDVSDGGGVAAADFKLNQSDVSDLQAYVSNLGALGAPLKGDFKSGMTYKDAYKLYKQSLVGMNADIGLNGETDTNGQWQQNLAYIQQILDYVGSDPAHRIIGPQDMGILKGMPLGRHGWNYYGAPGAPLDSVEAALDEQLIADWQRIIGDTKVIDKDLNKDIPAFSKRQQNILNTEKAEVKRITGIKAQLAKLKIVDDKMSLSEADLKLAQAHKGQNYNITKAHITDTISALTGSQNAYTSSAANSDLITAIGGLNNEIAAENAQPIANTLYIAQLTELRTRYETEQSEREAQTQQIEGMRQAYQDQLSQLAAHRSISVGDARIASAMEVVERDKNNLLRQNLTNSLVPIRSNLQVLGGSSTSAGQPGSGGSIYGSLSHALSTMRAGLTANQGYASAAAGGLPGREEDILTMHSNLGSKFDTSLLSAISSTTTTDTTATTADDTALIQAQAQQLQALGTLNQILQDQYAVLKDLPPYAGAFALGGTVPGPIGAPAMALVHGGEEITPPGSASTNSTGVKVRVEDHRTRVWVNDVEQIINSSNRQSSRRASRNLPGRGGGGF